MIEAKDINRILGIKESYELPERMMELLLNDSEGLFKQFLELETDLSYDWFNKYFQEEHSNRNAMMQDFTPREVAAMLPALAGNYNSVADVCAGTGGLTIAAWEHNHDAAFYCEELSTRAIPLLLFNLAIRGIRAIVVNKDVLKNEVYAVYSVYAGRVSRLQSAPKVKADIVVTNPPYSLKRTGRDNPDDERFQEYGYPPSQFSDYAFIIHALSLLKEGGSVYAILPHGVLFRGSREADIRKKLIQNNRFCTVIGLPPKMFLNTDIPTCICVFGTGDGNILFVDASGDYTKAGKINRIEEKHVNRILDTCRKRSDSERYAHVAGQHELEKNEYNLNIPRYVDTFEPEECPDIDKVIDDICRLDMEIYSVTKTIINTMQELHSQDAQTQRQLESAISRWKAAIEHGT